MTQQLLSPNQLTSDAGRGAATCAQSVWHLVSQKDESGTARRNAINEFPFTIGRRADLRLCLSCESVSGLHCTIEREGDELWIEDQHSRNGTFVNGRRISERTQLLDGDLLQIATVMFRVARQDEESQSHTQHAAGACDQALAVLQFEKLMSVPALVPYFQPIVNLKAATPEVIGYEVLSRSPLVGLQTPSSMFLAAALLNQEVELSQLCRSEGMRASASLATSPHLFLNTHPAELADPAELCYSLQSLRNQYPEVPFTLEIHEAAVADTATMRLLKRVLNHLRIGLAYDDFGAGQARLIELVDVPPDFLKFDRSLVQAIHTASLERQQMLGTLVRMAAELGIATLAEGIECIEEAEVCRQLGFNYSQGYLHGRPAPVEKLETAAAP
jgi:EAL domain-containing protein (putative c-di-GMP-specific phosphodiesterase class I)